jgi:hypothetical protein
VCAQCEAVLHALVAGLGSEEEAVVADCLRGLRSLAASPGAGGSEVLGQRLLGAGVAPQLDSLWARPLLQHEGDGLSGPDLSPPAMALAMALCAGLVQLPGLAAALVAFEAPATLAAAAKGSRARTARPQAAPPCPCCEPAPGSWPAAARGVPGGLARP